KLKAELTKYNPKIRYIKKNILPNLFAIIRIIKQTI
ncbi:unnamed protein product, partial [marine sediment metagenome]